MILPIHIITIRCDPDARFSHAYLQPTPVKSGFDPVYTAAPPCSKTGQASSSHPDGATMNGKRFILNWNLTTPWRH
jgi:hypothetical protein